METGQLWPKGSDSEATMQRKCWLIDWKVLLRVQEMVTLASLSM